MTISCRSENPRRRARAAHSSSARPRWFADRASRPGFFPTPSSRPPCGSSQASTAARNAAWCRRPGVLWVLVRMPCASVQSVQNLIDLLRCELLVVMPVHHHHRRAGAGGQAFLFALQEHAAVFRTLAELDSVLLLAMADDVLGAVQPARDVGADRHV